MISLLLITSFLIFVWSVVILIRTRPESAPVTFVFLGFLHVLLGGGYLFRAMYRHWSWGARYPTASFVELTEATYFYILIFCLTLLGLGLIRRRLGSAGYQTSQFQLRPFTSYEFLIALVLIIIYILGLIFGTLRIAPDFVLPFRLNGIIEIVTLFLLPLYISIRLLRAPRGFWVGLAVMSAYGAITLVTFGGKAGVMFPLVVFLSTAFYTGKLTLARMIIPTLVILSVYTVINPFYFRVAIDENSDSSPIQLLKESFESASFLNASSRKEHILSSSRNLSYRITSVIPMQQAIDSSSIAGVRLLSDVSGYYNEEILPTPEGTNEALGHFGFFMILFGNHVLGFFVGLLVLLFIFFVCFRLDRHNVKSGTGQRSLLGLMFVLTLLPFLLDGNYDNLSGYLHIAFSLMFIRFVFPRLLSVQPQAETRRRSRKLLSLRIRKPAFQ